MMKLYSNLYSNGKLNKTLMVRDQTLSKSFNSSSFNSGSSSHEGLKPFWQYKSTNSTNIVSFVHLSFLLILINELTELCLFC